MKTYEVYNQLSGAPESATSWAAAQALQARVKAEYIASHVDPLFAISVLVENEDGTVTQALANENGEPVIAGPELTALSQFVQEQTE